MVKSLITLLIVGFLVVIPTTAQEANVMLPDGPEITDQSQYTKDWWENVYEMRIKKDHYKEIKRKTDGQCDKKITWYTEKLTGKPTSEYYKHKLEKWQKRCK